MRKHLTRRKGSPHPDKHPVRFFMQGNLLFFRLRRAGYHWDGCFWNDAAGSKYTTAELSLLLDERRFRTRIRKKLTS